MPTQPEPWGGQVRFPRWMRRGRRNPQADDTPERQREAHDGVDASVSKSIPDNARDLLGASSIMLPRDQRRSDRH